jgi:hypothetical protein
MHMLPSCAVFSEKAANQHALVTIEIDVAEAQQKKRRNTIGFPAPP